MYLQYLFFFCIFISISISVSINQTEDSDINEGIKFINTKLIACSEQSEDEDQRSAGCQRLTNMNVPNNSSLSCLDPFLKISFKIFQKWIITDETESFNDSDDTGTHYTSYVASNNEGYLVELNNLFDFQENFVLSINDSIVNATSSKTCKKIRR
jgi:hypothetical protein